MTISERIVTERCQMKAEKNQFSAGLGAKICGAWAEANGVPEELNALAEKPEILRGIIDVLHGRSEIKPIELIVDLDATPFTPDGWTVESHKSGGQWKYDATKVSLYLSEGQKDGKCLTGTKLRQELESLFPPVMNANMLEFYLAHTSLIPEDWKGKVIFFWGTIYRNADGNLYVRFLYWSGGRWCWYCDWLENDWSSAYPATLLGK